MADKMKLETMNVCFLFVSLLTFLFVVVFYFSLLLFNPCSSGLASLLCTLAATRWSQRAGSAAANEGELPVSPFLTSRKLCCVDLLSQTKDR